jgi:regulator of protease activity HflC (stomatin/prohibitin superfamily)
MTKEKEFHPLPGWGMLVVIPALFFGSPLLGALYGLTQVGQQPSIIRILPVLLIPVCMLAALIGLFGFMAVQPNTARVLLLFGNYVGSVRKDGFYWVNPFYTKKILSLRVRNFETGSLTTPEKKEGGMLAQKQHRSGGRPSKVNDRDGNPIEISAVVVWRVVDTAEAVFEVDDFEDFVATQSESALRNLASRHPYDSEDHEVSLRANIEDISEALRRSIQDRLVKAGVDVIEARISHLAYAPEIAAAMLQRQQATAVIAARTKIVDGAVGMVEMALKHLSDKDVVHLDDERRAAMVSNLLVVLCSGGHAQPVVNTGTLYQ